MVKISIFRFSIQKIIFRYLLTFLSCVNLLYKSYLLSFFDFIGKFLQKSENWIQKNL